LLAAGVDPGGLDFAGYLEQHVWAVQLPRQPRYWHSYRIFGVAARVHLDQEVTDQRDAIRQAVEGHRAGQRGPVGPARPSGRPGHPRPGRVAHGPAPAPSVRPAV
jgi:hypothetical protein